MHSRQMLQQKLMLMLMRPDRSPLRGKPWRLNHRPRLLRMMMILGANGREEKKAGNQLHQLKLQWKKMAAEFFWGDGLSRWCS